jgi:hypothetical protein
VARLRNEPLTFFVKVTSSVCLVKRQGRNTTNRTRVRVRDVRLGAFSFAGPWTPECGAPGRRAYEEHGYETCQGSR